LSELRYRILLGIEGGGNDAMLLFQRIGRCAIGVALRPLAPITGRRRLSVRLIPALIFAFVATIVSPAASIENPGFEAGWRGWTVAEKASDDTAISGVPKSGEKSAKITGGNGLFEQRVGIEPEFDYELIAYISGTGTVGVIVGDETIAVDMPGDGEKWIEINIPFAAGSVEEITIFGAFIKGDVRFDDFALFRDGEPYQAIAIVDEAEAEKKKAAAAAYPRPTSDSVSSYGLKTGVAPSENFDLTDWKLTLPIDLNEDGKADEISEVDMAGGWSDPEIFYTDPVTGGMVFRTPQTAGSATTLKSKYRRTELREMLRAGDLSIDTRNSDGTPNENNWVFPGTPDEAQETAGGVGGMLRATLAVNQVTRIGDPARVGRVVIAQIHSKDHEPLRLYYRKLPTNKFGSIYYAYESADKQEVFFDLIGDRGDFVPNPKDGIALDELFSYEIRVESDLVDQQERPFLKVKIIRDNGAEVMAEPLDLTESGYLVSENYLYFKAGLYSQNDANSWQEYDADQVTYYKLENSHD